MSPSGEHWSISPLCIVCILQLAPAETTTTNTIIPIAPGNASFVGFDQLSRRLLIKSVDLTRPTAVLHEYDYPRLRRYLYANSLPHCPICVSLAPNRNYFIRSEWGNSWSLRLDIEDDIGIDNSRLSNCGRCSVLKELRRL